MKYTYNNFLDKSKEGVIKEVSNGLLRIGFYMYTTLGFPFDVFLDKINDLSLMEQISFYLYFKNNYKI